MTQACDARQRDDERIPPRSPLSERPASGRRDAVVPPPPLAGFLDPPSANQVPAFHPIEHRIERRGVKRQHTAGPDFDQLGDLVAVTGAVLEQRQDEHLRAAFLEGRIGRYCQSHMYE
jgi:hypothetical protein